MSPSDYTICLTNYARPEHLRRCLQSVAGCRHVVVASYGATDEHRKIIDELRPGTRCYLTPEDYGCNRLWMQAVALAHTPRVVILHDDDQLTPDFSATLARVDPKDASFIAWNGKTEWYGNKEDHGVNPWGGFGEGLHPTSALVDDVTNPHGGMVRSPVTMMLRRETALAVLSWCEEGLKDYHTRPTMMIGNEIALLLGHIHEGGRWYHINRPLVKFGHWEGSETVKWLNGENPELIALYDKVREKFGAEQPYFDHSKVVPTLVHVHTTGGDSPRKQFARTTWETEYRTMEKEYLIVPVRLESGNFRRNSGTVGDPRCMPFVKDLAEAGLRMTRRPGDVVVVSNDDVCLVEGALRKFVDRVREVGATYTHRRDFHKRHLDAIGAEAIGFPLSPDEVREGFPHSGTDLIAFTPQWWRDHALPHFPDFIVGCEAWDTIMIMLMRAAGCGWGFKNQVYHEYHGGWWETGQNRFSNPGQLHNRRLAKEYLQAYGIYKGEFEHGCKKDPANPRNPPGLDGPADPPAET